MPLKPSVTNSASSVDSSLLTRIFEKHTHGDGYVEAGLQKPRGFGEALLTNGRQEDRHPLGHALNNAAVLRNLFRLRFSAEFFRPQLQFFLGTKGNLSILPNSSLKHYPQVEMAVSKNRLGLLTSRKPVSLHPTELIKSKATAGKEVGTSQSGRMIR